MNHILFFKHLYKGDSRNETSSNSLINIFIVEKITSIRFVVVEGLQQEFLSLCTLMRFPGQAHL